jgi:Chaperone of endosialidase
MSWDPFGSKASKKIKAAAAAAAEAAREKAQAEAKAFRYNAAVLEKNSEQAEMQGYVDEARVRRQGNRFLGEQGAAIAGSGFDSGMGWEDLRQSTERELDLDAIIVRRQGQMRAADFHAQSELALMGAEQAILAGEAAAKMAILNGQIQAQTAQNSAITGTIGLAVQAAGVYYSDARIKDNVEQIGVLPTGDHLYAFNYIWEPTELRRIGVMAHEVRERVPEAVSVGDDGILCVDYGKLGLPHGYSLTRAIKRGRR